LGIHIDFENPPDEDEFRMQIALQSATQAITQGEVPVGAVIYHQNQLIAKAYNQRETLQDPTAHAELLAITQAANTLGQWRLDECTLYVTLEPCAMCAGAIVLARIGKVVYGADDPKAGACGSVLDILGCQKLNHNPVVIRGVLAEPCGQILSDFFRQKRKNNKGSASESLTEPFQSGYN